MSDTRSKFLSWSIEFGRVVKILGITSVCGPLVGGLVVAIMKILGVLALPDTGASSGPGWADKIIGSIFLLIGAIPYSYYFGFAHAFLTGVYFAVRYIVSGWINFWETILLAVVIVALVPPLVYLREFSMPITAGDLIGSKYLVLARLKEFGAAAVVSSLLCRHYFISERLFIKSEATP